MCVYRGGGSPRAHRAWPLAWPSPSGPLGRQRLRRSRVGPEDPFYEAVRKDLGVPLTLEGPTRTMRGVPVPVAVTLRTAIGALGASVTASPCSCGAASGHDGGDRMRPVPGQSCAAARRAVGLPPEGRGESCRPATARPPATLAAYHRSPGRSTLLDCSRQLALPVRAVGVARRRRALEAVEKFVTVFPGAQGRH